MFEKWLKLELNGYYNTNEALTKDVMVPKYRSVIGQYYDRFGRPLVIDSRLAFINERPLREGIVELEEMLSRASEYYTLVDPIINEELQTTFGVSVSQFTFSSIQINGIISAVRTQLIEHLSQIELHDPIASPTTAFPKDEVIELRPNFYGLGVKP